MFAVVDPMSGLAPGERAPDFTLPAVHRDGTVSLSDYRGRSAVLLAIFRGLYCPFCRHAIAQLGRAYEPLRAAGVEALGVVATEISRARLYFKHRPTRLPLVADPECTTHAAYGLPRPPLTPPLMEAVAQVRTNVTGELPAPIPLLEVPDTLNRLHGFDMTASDEQERDRQFGQLKGQFLIDREGVVRWRNVECARDGLDGFGRVPSNEELLKLARDLA